MTASSLPPVPPRVNEALLSVLEERRAVGEPEQAIFDERQIVDLVHQVIERSQLPLDTPRQLGAARRLSWYAVGRYAEIHKIV